MMPANKKQAPTTTAQSKPTTTQSKKRKLDPGMQKYYAVRAGARPGIYLTWLECQKQIAGFKGAQFKSFTNREDAAAFVAGKNPKSTSDEEPRFYAVAVGNRPGIYTDWPAAQLAIQGAKGPKYKRFASRQEAEAYIRTFGAAATKAALGGAGVATVDDEEVLEPVAKKTRTATEKRAPSNLVQVYTDGSSLSNGRAGAVAGVGVYFGLGDSRNISEPLAGDIQTNQRAELTAILRALQSLHITISVEILTDSKYSISCVTEWYVGWERNGWQTRDGPVKNQDLVQAVREMIEMRDGVGAITTFTWVKGHAQDPGNIAADRLAVAGARKARPLPGLRI